jgi:bifunctional non-homologous end joining protein LigD
VRQYPERLYAFDMLATDDRGLPSLSLMERRRYLRESFADSGMIAFVNGVIGAGNQVFELVQSYGFEGMFCKRLASTYQKGRSRDWLKIKQADYEGNFWFVPRRAN